MFGLGAAYALARELLGVVVGVSSEAAEGAPGRPGNRYAASSCSNSHSTSGLLAAGGCALGLCTFAVRLCRGLPGVALVAPCAALLTKMLLFMVMMLMMLE